ncbi:MAG: hypothetical protein AAFX87_28990 [Bacteroidota bacterium]
MHKFKLLILPIFTMLAVSGYAQEIVSDRPAVVNTPPIPVEILPGHRSFFYQHVISKDIFNDKFNFFNISAFDAEYGSDPTNEFVIASFFSYKLSKSISAGVMGQIIPKGASVFLGAKYNLVREDFLLVVFPSYRITANQVFSQFALVEYRPKISNKVNAYFRTQLLAETDGDELTRGFQQLRAGIQIKNSQFGLAANFDQFAGDRPSVDNFGVFFRLLIF